MNRLEPLGIYEVFVPGLEEGCMYKYLIETEKGDYLYKADPFAFYAESVRERLHVWRISVDLPGMMTAG